MYTVTAFSVLKHLYVWMNELYALCICMCVGHQMLFLFFHLHIYSFVYCFFFISINLYFSTFGLFFFFSSNGIVVEFEITHMKLALKYVARMLTITPFHSLYGYLLFYVNGNVMLSRQQCLGKWDWMKQNIFPCTYMYLILILMVNQMNKKNRRIVKTDWIDCPIVVSQKPYLNWNDLT